MKRILSLVLAGVLALGALTGCGGSKPGKVYEKEHPATPAPAAPVKLKIGQLPIVDGLPFWVGEKKGFFKNQDIDVELVPFRSANERDAALIAGSIDGMLADPIAISTLVASGTGVKITSLGLGATQEEGRMGIVASPKAGITKVEQLKGVEIAISNNSVMHYVTEKLLLEYGFKPEEIKLTNVPAIPVRFETLMGGQLKAAILPEPWFSLAVAGGAPVILDDTKAKQNYSLSVVAFTDKAIAEKAEGIKHFYLAYNMAINDIRLGPNEYMNLLIEKASVPAEVKTAYQIPPQAFAQAPKKEDLESVVQWLVDKQIIKSKLTYEQLVNATFLPTK